MALSANTSASNNPKASKPQGERKPLLMQKSQADLVQLAFAGPDFEADFKTLKQKTVDDELDVDERKKAIIKDVKSGWGDWAGPGDNGQPSKKILATRERLLAKAHEEDEKKRAGRRDSKMMNVILSDKRIKTASKYKISDIPHPFTTREEYEHSLQMPLGPEWNAAHVVKKNSAPDVLTRKGRIIEPVKLGVKRKKE